jgi:hypothetical protein
VRLDWVGMRAPLLRRSAFLAVLGTGLGLTAAGVHGVSGMDSSLQLAAAPTSAPAEHTTKVVWRGCERPDAQRRHKV